MKLSVTSSRYLAMAGLAAGLLAPVATQAAPIVHTTDFIADGSRTNFNDFETLPGTSTAGTALSPYSNDGITVTQVGGGDDIWTACTVVGAGCSGAHQDTRSWYPSSGDEAYTSITRTDGLDFIDVGLLVGSGFGLTSVTYTYDLRLDGAQVLFGEFSAVSSYLGFEGGGYDEVRLIATFSDPGITEIDGGVFQALQVDNIEAAGGGGGGGGTDVPEPMTLGLLGAGLAGIGAMRRRRA